jgi:hypothetical protein
MWLRWGIILGAGAVGVRAANRRKTRPDILDEDIEGKGASFLISQISSLKAETFVSLSGALELLFQLQKASSTAAC